MFLDASSHDVDDVESKSFPLLPRNYQTRSWDLDDFSCHFANRTGHVVILQGTPSWLAEVKTATDFGSTPW